jgi:hypothetical protein
MEAWRRQEIWLTLVFSLYRSCYLSVTKGNVAARRVARGAAARALDTAAQSLCYRDSALGAPPVRGKGARLPPISSILFLHTLLPAWEADIRRH